MNPPKTEFPRMTIEHTREADTEPVSAALVALVAAVACNAPTSTTVPDRTAEPTPLPQPRLPDEH